MSRQLRIAVLFVLLLLSSRAYAMYDMCFASAAEQYKISERLLRVIAKDESNFNPAAINWNANGSYDFGVMQINSSWYKTLGPEQWSRLGDPCVNIYTGAGILAGCIGRFGYSWEAVGCYNAVSSGKRKNYAWKIYKALSKKQSPIPGPARR